jgi:hypothetical protein
MARNSDKTALIHLLKNDSGALEAAKIICSASRTLGRLTLDGMVFVRNDSNEVVPLFNLE